MVAIVSSSSTTTMRLPAPSAPSASIGARSGNASTNALGSARSSPPCNRATRRANQLAEIARLEVEREAAHVEARHLEHLLEQGMQPLGLPLQRVHRARLRRLTPLDAPGQRVRESLDGGEWRLELVRRESEEAI